MRTAPKLNWATLTILLLMWSASGHSSALLPLSVNLAGNFPSDKGAYNLSISLDAETYAVTSFDLIVDGRPIPIPLSSFSKYDHLDLSNVRILLGRGEWLEIDGELYAPPFGVLSIRITSSSASCASEFAEVLLTVDTVDDYRWNLYDECRDDDA